MLPISHLPLRFVVGFSSSSKYVANLSAMSSLKLCSPRANGIKLCRTIPVTGDAMLLGSPHRVRVP
jgi:hypothetical protein